MKCLGALIKIKEKKKKKLTTCWISPLSQAQHKMGHLLKKKHMSFPC